MAKRIKQARQPNRRHLSRMEQERRMRRWLYIGVGATFGLVILLLAWGLVDPILQCWEQTGSPPLLSYAPGTWGPPEAEALLARDGRAWVAPGVEHSS